MKESSEKEVKFNGSIFDAERILGKNSVFKKIYSNDDLLFWTNEILNTSLAFLQLIYINNKTKIQSEKKPHSARAQTAALTGSSNV